MSSCVPPEKIHMCTLKENTVIYIVGQVNKCRFRGKNMYCRVFLKCAKENCKNDYENDHASFNQTNELIGYQNSADFCEIWPEYSLDVVKQKCVGDF